MITISGVLLKVFSAKTVPKNWRVQDFLMQTASIDGKPQKRKVQAARGAISQLAKFKTGDKITCDCLLRGREYEEDGKTKYHNIDECVNIRVFDGEVI